MKKIKKALRLLGLTLFILAAAFGVGLTGNFLSSREPFLHKEITTEQVDRKEEDGDEVKS